MVETNTLTLTATIASGSSLSNEVDMSAYALNKDNFRAYAIIPPIDFTGSITFQAIIDGTSYNVRDANGVEYVLTADDGDSLASEYVPLDPTPFSAISKMKIRYGTASTPVSAASDITFKIIARAFN